MVFEYNFFSKGYAYSDIRNVCSNFYNEKAKAAFLSAYGAIDEREVIIDDIAKTFPHWANTLLERVKDGRLLAAVEKFVQRKIIMSFDEFLSFRNVEIRNKDHERIVRMFYPHLTSVCGVPEALSKVIGEIIGVDFSGASIITGCFNGTNDDTIAPYGTPDLYCKWDSGIQVYLYGALPKSNFLALQPNEYVLFAFSDQITNNVEQTMDHHFYMRCAQ